MLPSHSHWVRALLLGFCWLLLAPGARALALQDIPPQRYRVTDLTGTLTEPQRQQLSAKLKALEERKGSQVAVLIVPTTEPETIEQYSIRVVDDWKLGRAKADDGLLFLIAKNDRKMKLEVGHGLEGPIPDAVNKRIISEVVVPHFKSGDFYGGIDAGLDRVVRLIDGEALPPPAAHDRGWESGADLYWFMFILAIVSGGFLRLMFGRLPGALLAGGFIGLLTQVLAGSLITAVILGVLAFGINLMFALPGRPTYGGQWRGGRRRGGYYGGSTWGGGPWIGGGTWTGGGGSWGGDSDSFSGGGGSFGGGGASGEW